jgi:hypothetical protein
MSRRPERNTIVIMSVRFHRIKPHVIQKLQKL